MILVVPAALPAALAGLPGLPLSPSPVPGEVVDTPDPSLVTPGTLGFLAIFAVAVALVFLVRDMVRRNRGIVVRAERRDEVLRRSADGTDGGTGGGGAPAASGGAAPTRPEQPRTPRERPDRDGQGPAAPIG